MLSAVLLPQQTSLQQISYLCTPVTKIVYFPPKWCTFQILFAHMGKRLLPTLTKCAHTFGNTENREQSLSTIVLILLNQNHNVTPCKNQYILYTGLIQALIFNKMQIPCNGHVCFLLNNVCCCGQHIHAHNQFRDHHLGTFMRTISSVIIT